MKRFAIFCGVLVMCYSMAFSQESSGAAFMGKSLQLGLDSPFLSYVRKTDDGQVKGMIGVNAAAGLSMRNYFKPVKYNAFNPYWSFGTVVVLIPYVGIGGDYVFQNGFYLGIGTFYIVPEIHAGFML